ncbi:MAG: PilZ domain-containing protein [Myxococcota bacterium]|nr:PilZ domain-containing protein [Myxococcota bacterium]
MSLIDLQIQKLFSDIILPAKVEVLLFNEQPPKWLQGELMPLNIATDGTDDLLVVRLSDSPQISLPLGAKIILNFIDQDGPMLSLSYYDLVQDKLQLQFAQIHQRDKRSFPRHYGNIPVKYLPIQHLEEELARKQWLSNSRSVTEDWLTPEPFMNFSLGGLSFETPSVLDRGTMLLLEIGIGENEKRWRATARVVRCIEILEEVFEIAVQFEDLPEEALDQLSELTLNIQEALL